MKKALIYPSDDDAIVRSKPGPLARSGEDVMAVATGFAAQAPQSHV